MTQTSGNLERLLRNERQVRKEKGWGIILVLSGPEGSWAGEAMSFYMLSDCLGPYITASRRKTSVLSEYAVVHSLFFFFFSWEYCSAWELQCPMQQQRCLKGWALPTGMAHPGKCSGCSSQVLRAGFWPKCIKFQRCVLFHFCLLTTVYDYLGANCSHFFQTNGSHGVSELHVCGKVDRFSLCVSLKYFII